MAFEKGNHEARPVAYQFGKSKTKGTEQVSITFQFVGGPNEGKRMTYNGWLTERTVERTLETLEHCGWDGVDVKAMKGFGTKNVELVIDEEAGQDGNMYPTIKWVNKLFSRGPGVVYGDEEMDGLAARLAQVNAARRQRLAKEESEPDPFGNG